MARTDGEARKNALLDAAIGCFVKNGVLATGIEDVRKAAGASPSSVYHLFSGMPALVRALLERTFERLFTHLTEHVTRAKTAEATVIALVDAHLEWVFQNRDEARVMYQAMTLELAGPEMDDVQYEKAKLLLPIVTHMSRFIEAGELPNWTPLVYDVVLLGPSHEACRRFLAGSSGLDSKWMRKTFPQLAWQSISTLDRKGATKKRKKKS